MIYLKLILLFFVCAAAQAESLRELYSKPLAEWPKPFLAEGVEHRPLGILPKFPEGKPELVALGHALFFEPKLSKSNQIACASCHDPENGWGDGRSVAIGHDRQFGNRNTMTILNSMHFQSLFWDGRASSPEQQSLMPISNPIEMAEDIDMAIAKISAMPKYQALFKAAFNTREIRDIHLEEALVAFQRTVVSRPSRFDLFISGQYKQLTDQEIKGLHLYRTTAGCINCHNGPLLSDGQFHNIGLSYFGRHFEDLGLYGFTRIETDKGKFRTPSLRDVRFTGPWMHNGLFPNLKGVLRMYNHGMTFRKELKPGEPQLSPLIKPLGLDQPELLALEAFLDSISTRPKRLSPPR